MNKKLSPAMSGIVALLRALIGFGLISLSLFKMNMIYGLWLNDFWWLVSSLCLIYSGWFFRSIKDYS